MLLSGSAFSGSALCEDQPRHASLFTTTAQIPSPVDYQFLGGASDDGLSARQRWFVDEIRKAEGKARPKFR